MSHGAEGGAGWLWEVNQVGCGCAAARAACPSITLYKTVEAAPGLPCMIELAICASNLMFIARRAGSIRHQLLILASELFVRRNFPNVCSWLCLNSSSPSKNPFRMSWPSWRCARAGGGGW